MITSSATRRLIEGPGTRGQGPGLWGERRTGTGSRKSSSGSPRSGRRPRACPLFPLAILLAIFPGVGEADDWPVARRNAEGTGVAAGKLADEPSLLWKYTAKASSFEVEPIVAGGVVYVGDADGTLHAVSLSDGKPLWTKRFEEAAFTSAAAVERDRLWIGDLFGSIRCLDLKEGAEVWSFDAETEVHGLKLHEGKLLATTEGGTLLALDAKSGEERWRFAINAPLQCAPTIAGGHTLLAGCDEELHAVDLATGKEVGSINIGGPTGSSAAVTEGVAYFGTEGGLLLAVAVADPASPQERWRYRDPRRGQGIRTAPAVGDKLVVYGGQGKAVYGVDRATGERAWVVPTRSRVESSPVIVGDTAVAATSRGRLMLIGLAEGEVLWEYNAGGGFTAPPAVVDGKLLIANTDGVLYCFASEEPQMNTDERR